MIFVLSSSHAQDSLSGVIFGMIDGVEEALPNANVGWMESNINSISDTKGNFIIERKKTDKRLFVSFIGFYTDTIQVKKNQHFVKVVLKEADIELTEVVVRDQQNASTIKKKDVGLTQLITAKELTKAACCNLSESFETNPAIDASFTDAVTGTRQIRLLGLDGPYSYYTRGNIPTMGGLASVLGLQLIPGSWIQSIQLTKGSGSVLNGFESVAGQVNYELRKPNAKEYLYGQLYGNAGGRLEQSAVYNQKINEHWGTNLMVYGRQNISKPDFNNDGFVDAPQGNMWIGQNTWQYKGHKGWESQFGLKFASNNQTGGQLSALDASPEDTVWRAKLQTNRFEYWQKIGVVFPNSPFRSIGVQVAFTYHDQNSDFGLPVTSTYSGLEKTLYANVIFQDIIKNTNHNYKLGISYKNQAIDEIFYNTLYLRREQIPGMFAEYSYLYTEQLSVVVGMRIDLHSQYGAFFTPRVHLRYAPAENHTFRINAGKAYRTANLFADNLGSMASNRVWNIQAGDEDLPYAGIKQEESINAGLSYAYTFELDYRPGSFRAEYFYTSFQNQLVKDWDVASTQIMFYNLQGQSFAHSAQIQLDWEVLHRLTARIAYRFVEAKTEYKSIGLASQPFIAKHRVFLNIGYESKKAWKFDATLNLLSSQRLPSTQNNPVEYRRADESPAFATLNVQIAKEFKERLEVHIGVENLFNYRQENPIVAANNPFAKEFDASMIWGPIMGRIMYGGIRLKLF